MNQIDLLKNFGYKLAKARDTLIRLGVFEKYGGRSDECVIEIAFLLDAINYLKIYKENENEES
jgi:hypothetical protein